jgi:hypothetical protein
MIGDHIRALKGGRWVHGIDGGDGAVLHLGEGPGPRVLRTYRPLFVVGAEAVEVVTHREPVFPPRSVVARAFGPLRDPALAAMFADSAAFAHWCKSGRTPEAPAAPAASPVAGARAARPARPARAVPRPRPRGGKKAPSRRAAGGRKAAAGKGRSRKPAPRKATPGRRGAIRKKRR